MAEGIKIGSAFIEVNADIKDAQGDVNRLQKSVNGSTATLNVRADTLVANGAIAVASRSRFVDLNLRVNGLAAVGKSLAALSGGAAVGKMLKGVGDGLSNLPANLPKIAMVSTSIFAIGGAALAATSGTIALAGGLASIAGAGLALPGLMAGFAIGAGTLIAALKDAPTVLADLGPAFGALQDTISSNFWDQAAAPIRDLTNSLLPQLSSGLGTIASDFGNAFSVAAGALKNELGVAALGEMMANVSQGIRAATGAIQPLIAAFTTLSAVGSDYLPELGAWLTTISEKFNSFIQGAAADGSLRGWIDSGISALQSLGSVIGSVASIFYGLYTAATSAGAAPLQVLADGLGKISAVVNGPAFQGALTTVFQGAAAGMQGLGAALGPVGDMFVQLAPTIGKVLELAGQLAGQALGGIATALSQPAFATGLMDFFTGIQTGVSAVLPHLPLLGQLLGTVGTVAGQLAAVIGPVLGTAIKVLAPAFTSILTALTPLIPILGGALMTVITALTPIVTLLVGVFAQLVPVIMQLIPPVTQIITALIPPLMAIFTALVPIIMTVVQAFVPLVTMIAASLQPTIQALMPVVMTVFGVIQSVITSVMGIVQGVIKVVTGAIKGDWNMVWNGIKQILQGVWNTIKAVISGAIGIIKSVVRAGIDFVSSVVRSVFNGISSFVSGVWRNISNFIRDGINNGKNFVSSGVESIKSFIRTGFDNAVNTAKDAFSRMATAVSDGITKAVNFVRDLPGKITSAVGNLGNLLYSAGQDIVNGMINGIRDMVGNLASTAANMAKGALDAAKNALGIKSPSREFIAVGEFSGEGAIKGMEAMSKKVARTAEDMMHLPTPSFAMAQGSNSITAAANSAGIGSRTGTSGSRDTIVQNVTITIDAKNVKDFQDVVTVLTNIKQTARTGRGVANARIS